MEYTNWLENQYTQLIPGGGLYRDLRLDDAPDPETRGTPTVLRHFGPPQYAEMVRPSEGPILSYDELCFRVDECMVMAFPPENGLGFYALPPYGISLVPTVFWREKPGNYFIVTEFVHPERGSLLVDAVNQPDLSILVADLVDRAFAGMIRYIVESVAYRRHLPFFYDLKPHQIFLDALHDAVLCIDPDPLFIIPREHWDFAITRAHELLYLASLSLAKVPDDILLPHVARACNILEVLDVPTGVQRRLRREIR